MKILFVAYQFPPNSGPAVHRNFGFANGLAERGHDVQVFTKALHSTSDDIRDNTYRDSWSPKLRVFPSPTHEESLLRLILIRLRVFRLFWYVCYPLFWERPFSWYLSEKNSLGSLYDSEDFDCVYTTSGPFTTMLFGRYLQKTRKARWVADLRDPFTDAYMWSFPSKLHWKLSRYFEQWLFSKPDMVIVSSMEYKKLLVKRGVRSSDSIQVITNGYDQT